MEGVETVAMSCRTWSSLVTNLFTLACSASLLQIFYVFLFIGEGNEYDVDDGVKTGLPLYLQPLHQPGQRSRTIPPAVPDPPTRLKPRHGRCRKPAPLRRRRRCCLSFNNVAPSPFSKGCPVWRAGHVRAGSTKPS